MKSLPSRASVLALVLLAGCASSPVPEPASVDVLEQNLIDAFAVRADFLLPDTIAAARSHYESLDELAGQWRVTRMAALYAMSKDDDERAVAEARRLDELRKLLNVLETRGLRIDYETDLIVGRALADDTAFRRAAMDATDDIDRAVALTYLGEHRRAIASLAEGSSRPADRAFVHYRHGVNAAAADHVERALGFYRQAGDVRGTADALFALARIESERGDRPAAIMYGERAQRALIALGDSARAEAVATWLSGQ